MSALLEDPFEINDFTTASDWEKFISDLETLFRQWKLGSNHPSSSSCPASPDVETSPAIADLTSIKWQQKLDTLRFSKVSLDISHVICRDKNGRKITSEDLTGDFFPSSCPPIARLFGLTEYIVISGRDNDPIGSQDKTKLLLSSASMALDNTGCLLPVFVNVDHRTNTLFSGVQTTKHVRILFDMIHLRKFNDQYQFLTNLSGLFKEKLGRSSTDCPPLTTSIRFTKDFRDFPEAYVHLDLPIDWEDFPPEVSKTLDFVPYVEPIQRIRVCYSWKDVSENIITESAFHSDLDPFSAHEISVEVCPVKNIKSSLKEYIQGLYNLVRGSPHSESLHRRIMQSYNKEDVLEVLDRLASTAGDSADFTGPVKQLVMKLVAVIFDFGKTSPEVADDLLKDHKPFKSCPFDSLTWRIAHCLLFSQISLPDPPAFSFLWKEIIRCLRKHWESSVPIPGLEPQDGNNQIVHPDSSSGLLHQKLQMLNCCIQQKLKWESEREGDEEFYDAEEEVKNESQSIGIPEGRLHPLKDLSLLNDPNQPLYVPICQDPTPMTDDMLQQQAEVMSTLSSTSERMKMQISTLISDMEAFKAANPGCTLEDFVRWYSPRDYSEEEGLSRRMKEEGNTWKEAWDSCLPVPVSRQKLLFDYHTEGENVLAFLTNLMSASLSSLILPIVVHSACAQLSHQRRSLLEQTENDTILQTVVAVNCTPDNMTRVFYDLKEFDDQIHIMKSLRKKIQVFRENDQSIPLEWKDVIKSASMTGQSTVKFAVADSRHRKLLCKMLHEVFGPLPFDDEKQEGNSKWFVHNAEDILSNPTRKEYVLNVSLPRPSSSSTCLPQRLYSTVTDDYMTMASSLSQDITFI